MTGLFDGTFARGPVAGVLTDEAWLRALLAVEAALARAAARLGLVPTTAADAVSAACADPGGLDLARVVREASDAGNPVPPLVKVLQAAVGPRDSVAVLVGATSQDVLDTALMLLARDALDALDGLLFGAGDAAAGLASEHRDDVVMGRTLLQQALPTPFGLTAAGWTAGLDEVRARVAEVRAALPLQYGGAVGTLAAGSGSGISLRGALAEELHLETTTVAWHTLRLPIADLAGVLGAVAGVVATIALDVVLMAQSEVGEVSEQADGRGGSSAMPHKSNPVAAISVRACAHRAPGLVATLYTAMEQEHERAAGAWHSEWPTLTELLRTVGSGAAWLQECLEGLQVDTERMAATVAEAAGPQMAAAATDALAGSLGRGPAHELVAEAVRSARETGVPLADVLAERSGLDPASLRTPPDVGEAGAQVDDVLAAHRTLTEGAL